MKNMDELIEKAVFGESGEKKLARKEIRQIAKENGIVLCSINEFYEARGKGEVKSNFTAPAINIRGMAYDSGRAVFEKAKELQVGAFILEIAKSEMEYTDQEPDEYVCVMLAAAIREGFSGPLFIQGDHFQTKVSEVPGEPKEEEIDKLKKLIKLSLEAGFYNFGIDCSTLVNLEKESVAEQQKNNIIYTLELLDFVRSNEPKGVKVALGGEIGHIGGKNSTAGDFKVFMDGVNKGLAKRVCGLVNISVQTGTHHGGVVLPSGKLADVSVDFGVLKELSQLAKEYGIGGVVQHGASTLPDEYFRHFPEVETLEIHLATQFQNMILDHASFPRDLLSKMYNWLDKEKNSERQEGWTDKQFHYKLRKKALGEFKKECWEIDEEARKQIRQDLGNRFEFLFRELKVVNTKRLVEKYAK